MTKTALITGGAKRIGKAIALGLAQRGWNIALHYSSSQAEAAQVLEQIQALNVSTIGLQADLADSEKVETLIPQAHEALGEVSLLVNNASLFERDTSETLSVDSWNAHIDVNLRAPALLMRDFAAQSEGGNIINIIDQRVWRLTPDFASYTVSKTGLWTLTQTFAQALAPKKIRVNGIGPGPTLPNPRQDVAEFEKQARLVPLGHGASPEEMVTAVDFILNAPSMTGQMIALDGGQHLAWQTPDVTEVVE
ncbi:MAG: SDR family oxidoreductase [Parvibaculales bacterium]